MEMGEEMVEVYDMIYVIFLMSVFDFIKNSLLVVESGWVEVDKEMI